MFDCNLRNGLTLEIGPSGGWVVAHIPLSVGHQKASYAFLNIFPNFVPIVSEIISKDVFSVLLTGVL